MNDKNVFHKEKVIHNVENTHFFVLKDQIVVGILSVGLTKFYKTGGIYSKKRYKL